jgi:uncharacterized membrane protein
MNTKEFVTTLDEARISQAIAEAEKRTSGEIRVYVTDEKPTDILATAEKAFVKLGMAATAQRNAVLIYFAPAMRGYAIYGDKGIHENCGQYFWEAIREGMKPLLKQEKFTESIIYAVREVGEALSKNFPWQAGDRNELPNDVIRDPKKDE